MKKVSALILAVIMLFGCVACSKEPNIKDLHSVQLAYSVKNVESNDFIVEVPSDFSSIEPYKTLYSPDGLYIKMSKKAKIYDLDGNEIERKNLIVGDVLEIYYDGTLASNNPKTIIAYKIVKIA